MARSPTRISSRRRPPRSPRAFARCVSIEGATGARATRPNRCRSRTKRRRWRPFSTGSRRRKRICSPTTTAPKSRSSSRSTSRPGRSPSRSSRPRWRVFRGKTRRSRPGATFSRLSRARRGRRSRKNGSSRRPSTWRASWKGLSSAFRLIYGRARVAGGSLARPAHPGPTQAERLGEIRARTIVLVGDREDPERLRCAAAIVQGIRGAEGATFAGASRFLHMEDPRHVMRRLTDFYIPPEE